jgi:hypothetical protein
MNRKETHVYRFNIEWNNITKIKKITNNIISIANVKYIHAYKFNSIQFFIMYVPSQQLQGQLQTQHSVYKQIQLQCLTWDKKHIIQK